MSETQLWLSVIEDGRCAWPPTLDQLGWRVALSVSQTLQGCELPPSSRSSPLFPASPDAVPPKLDVGTHYIYLLCFRSAFTVLARLVEQAPPDIRSGLFFSLGLASVVCISPHSNLLDQIAQLCGDAPWASEVWRVEQSKIVSVTPQLPPQPSAQVSAQIFEPYHSLPLAQRMTADEFVSSMGLLLPRVALHMPEDLPTFNSIVALAGELLSEMKYVSNPVGTPPPTLSEYTEEDFRDNRALAQMVLHQATDRLIQINAALSYLSTQAFSGAVPILERRSLIRRYSLLGVGTAILALTKISRSIERAFAAGAVETVLSDYAETAAPLPGLDKLPDYDPSGWKDHSVDRWDGKMPIRDLYPKVAYFSGTLGFRESEYSISAAMQALAAGGGPEWSLLTLTHELVHGHVRRLLSLVLEGDPERRPEIAWNEIYLRFVDLINGRPATNSTFLDSLRAIILFYCCMTMTHGSLSRKGDGITAPAGSDEVRLGFYRPNDPEMLRQLLENEYRNINEVLVHVLDLHYFYRSSLSAYVPLIWRSWSIMPQVRGDPRHYILRTLLVAATKTAGTPFSRFNQSRALVIELLSPLKEGSGSGTATVQAALTFLADDVNFSNLFYAFTASLVLVDLAHQVLTSNAIRGRLIGGDPHLTIKSHPALFEEWFEYEMPDGFVDEVVVAPLAYLADRLARKISHGESNTLELETAIIFLACCSHSTD